MKRKLYLIVFALLLLGTGAFSVALYLVNEVIASYTPTLERILSEKIGADVTLGKIKLSLLQQEISTTSVSIKSSVRTDPASDNSDLITLGGIKATANLRALFERRLELESLSLEEISVVVVRDQTGVKVSGLPIKKEVQRNESPGAIKEAHPNGDSAKSANLPLTLSLKKIELKKGAVQYKDILLGKNFTATDISVSTELEVNDSVVELRKFAASGTVSDIGPLSAGFDTITTNLTTQSVAVNGGALTLTGGTIGVTGSYNGTSGEVLVRTDTLSLRELSTMGTAFAPQLSTLSPTGSLSFNLRTEFSTAATPYSFHLTGPLSLSNTHIQISPKIKVENTSAQITLDLSPGKHSVVTKDLTSTINGETITSQFTALLEGDRLTVNPFEYTGLSATKSPLPHNGKGTFRVTFNDTFDFANQFSGAALSLEKIALAFKPELSAVISGTVQAVENEVFGEMKRVPDSLRAHGSAHLINGAIKGVNLPGLVLKKVDGIPFLQGSLLSLVPPLYQPLFSSPDTPYSSIQVTYGLSGKDLSIKDLKVVSDIFSLSGNGSIRGSGELDLDTTISFTQPFSLALSTSIPQLRQILTADERLVFPLQISGVPPMVVVTPNLKEVLKLAAQRMVKDKAQDILNKTLDGAVKGWGKGLGF
jgi:hypothetical protein